MHLSNGSSESLDQISNGGAPINPAVEMGASLFLKLMEEKPASVSPSSALNCQGNTITNIMSYLTLRDVTRQYSVHTVV